MEKAVTENLLKNLKGRGLFHTISRLRYLPYKMQTALQAVEAIGKSRNPRFVIDDENRFAYENLIRWVHGDPEMKCLDPATKEIVTGRLNAGIYIAGSTGTGKSWALEIMAAYSLIDNVNVNIGEHRRPLFWKNVRTDAICDEYTATGSFDKFKKIQIVGFQDLGAEPKESLYMGNRINVMQQILEYRGDRTDLITHITSNLPFHLPKSIEPTKETIDKAIYGRFGDRVASRLNEMCNYFEIIGKDRRRC